MAGSANPSGAVQPTQNAYSPNVLYANPAATQPVATGSTPVAPGSAMPNVYSTASNLYNQAAAGPNINQFMNPYTGMVTATTLQDLERQRQMQTNDIGYNATRANAFGGSRQGVAEALTNEAFARQGANTFANLNQQGFNTALSAAQGQQGIDSALAQQGFNFGNTIGAQQTAQGQAQRDTNQALIDAIKAQYGGFTGAPNNALAGLISALGGASMGQSTTSQTTKNNPGALNILSGLLAL